MNLSFFTYLESFNDFLWGEFLGIPLILLLGLYFTLKSRFIQVHSFHVVVRNFFQYFKKKDSCSKGIHPLKVFFASVGGCVGIGNIVGICEALKYGGPGSLFWIWVTGLVGMILKYSEVYLGMKFRRANAQGGYDGGPMYYLPHGLSSPWLKKWLPRVICLLLCIYGIEIYQFSIINDTLTESLGGGRVWITGLLFLIIMGSVQGGMKRVANISGTIVPIFIVLFSLMSLYILAVNLHQLPQVLYQVVSSAFTGHAAVGGFLGATVAQTISYGIKRSCYSGDVGIGYASVVHSESEETNPHRQASLAILGIFLDTFVVCSFSILVVLFTGVWQGPLDASHFVKASLEQYFFGVSFFWPLFIFMLGYSTIITFFAMGVKTATFLGGERGKQVYFYFAGALFILFSLFDASKALVIMEISGGCLLVLNLLGIYLLRREISFKVPKDL